MNHERVPAVFQIMGAAAVFAAALLFITAFDWGSPPSANGLPMRAVAAARAR